MPLFQLKVTFFINQLGRRGKLCNFRRNFVAIFFLFIQLIIASILSFSQGGELEKKTENEEVRRLLNKCLETQCKMDRVSFRGVTEGRIQALDPQDQRPLHQRQEFLFRRDGERVDVRGSIFFLDKRTNESLGYRDVVNKEYAVHYQYEYPKRKGPDEGFVSTNVVGNASIYVGSIAHSGPLDGNFLSSGRRRLAALLIDGGNYRLFGEEQIQNIPCKIVEGTTRYGAITLWIAETKGFIPLKVVQEKGPDDIFFNEKPLSEHPKHFKFNLALIRWSAILDEVRVSQIGQTFVPFGGRITENYFYERDRKEITVCNYNRTEIDLNAHFEDSDAFVTDLPEGSPVTYEQEKDSGINYVWGKGKTVPGGVEYQGGRASGVWPKRPVIITLAGGVLGVLLLVIGGLLIFRKKGSGKPL